MMKNGFYVWCKDRTIQRKQRSKSDETQLWWCHCYKRINRWIILYIFSFSQQQKLLFFFGGWGWETIFNFSKVYLKVSLDIDPRFAPSPTNGIALVWIVWLPCTAVSPSHKIEIVDIASVFLILQVDVANQALLNTTLQKWTPRCTWRIKKIFQNSNPFLFVVEPAQVQLTKNRSSSAHHYLRLSEACFYDFYFFPILN